MSRIRGFFPGLFKKPELGVAKKDLMLLNQAGAQRMLTQKLVKLLMMKRFEVGDKSEIENEIQSSISKFEETLEILKSFEENTEALNSQMEKVEGAWERFLSSVTINDIEKIIEFNGEVLIEMERAVNMYEEMFLKMRKKNAYAG